MARLSRADLEAIIKKEMPGHRLCDRLRKAAVDAGRAAVDGVTPEIDVLKRKYSGDRASSAQDKARSTADRDSEIVLVEPEVSPGHPSDPAIAPKAVVVSTSQRKIVGRQG